MIELALPIAQDYERLVLGAAMQDADSMTLLRSVLTDDDFALEKHRRIWDAAVGLYDAGTAVDRMTLAAELQRRSQLQSVDGVSYLCDLDVGLRLPNIESYIVALREKATMRRMMRGCQEILDRCSLQVDSAKEVLDYAGQVWADLVDRSSVKARGFVRPAEVIQEHGIDRLLSPKREAGISLPWPWLDGILFGLREEQLVILGARTSVGKTAAALQIAAHAARRGKRVPLFSLEMSKEALTRRLVNQMSGVDGERIRRGATTQDERLEIMRSVAEIDEMPLYIDDTSACNTAAIHAALRKFTLKHGPPHLVIVDHLHIMQGSGKDRQAEISGITRQLKGLAREFKCPFLVPAQLNRSTARDNEPPDLPDLRDSGAIEQDADVVVFLHAWAPEEGSDLQRARIIVGKQREGARNIWRDVVYMRNTQRFEEIDGTYDN